MSIDDKKEKAAQEALAAYEKLRQKLSKILGGFNDTITSESINKAMDKAMAELKELGEHSKDVVTSAGETLKKDITTSVDAWKSKVDTGLDDARKQFDHMQNKGGALWKEIAHEAQRIKDVSLDKSGAFLFNVSKGLAEWAKSVSEKLDSSLTYKTGEVTHGGEFSCSSCGTTIKLKQPGRLPPCPKCAKTEFRRA